MFRKKQCIINVLCNLSMRTFSTYGQCWKAAGPGVAQVQQCLYRVSTDKVNYSSFFFSFQAGAEILHSFYMDSQFHKCIIYE